MRKSIDLDSPAALKQVVPRGIITCSDRTIVILRRPPARNDPMYRNRSISHDDLEPWMQNALAANGFIDVAITDTAPSGRSMSYQAYHHAALPPPSFTLGAIVVAAIQAAGAIARRAYASHQQRRQARIIADELHQLDDRMLRDLGFDRSEIASVAAEWTGKAEHTRVRVLPPLRSVPKP